MQEINVSDRWFDALPATRSEARLKGKTGANPIHQEHGGSHVATLHYEDDDDD